jgi:small subunit ribosomal protein S6
MSNFFFEVDVLRMRSSHAVFSLVYYTSPHSFLYIFVRRDRASDGRLDPMIEPSNKIFKFCGKLRPRNTGTLYIIIRAFPFQARPRLELEQTHGKEVFPMRKYELMCIIQPDLDETAFNGVLDKVKGWVGESGGNVDKAEVWGRRRMAYIINKHREGQYVLLNVTMDPAATSELERNLRFQESIMRHMLSVVG